MSLPRSSVGRSEEGVQHLDTPPTATPLSQADVCEEQSRRLGPLSPSSLSIGGGCRSGGRQPPPAPVSRRDLCSSAVTPGDPRRPLAQHPPMERQAGRRGAGHSLSSARRAASLFTHSQSAARLQQAPDGEVSDTAINSGARPAQRSAAGTDARDAMMTGRPSGGDAAVFVTPPRTVSVAMW